MGVSCRKQPDGTVKCDPFPTVPPHLRGKAGVVTGVSAPHGGGGTLPDTPRYRARINKPSTMQERRARLSKADPSKFRKTFSKTSSRPMHKKKNYSNMMGGGVAKTERNGSNGQKKHKRSRYDDLW